MQQALIETNLAQQPHRLTLDSRSRLSITGVLEVESFDDTEILLTSTRGPMSIRGQGLHLQQLSIDGGQVLVDGSVDAISYEDDIPRGGFQQRQAQPNRQQPSAPQQKSFDDMLKQFMSESDSKMSSIRAYSDHKTKTRKR